MAGSNQAPSATTVWVASPGRMTFMAAGRGPVAASRRKTPRTRDIPPPPWCEVTAMAGAYGCRARSWTGFPQRWIRIRLGLRGIHPRPRRPGRDGRPTSGSASVEQLAGVEDARRIQGGADGAQEGDLRRRPCAAQVGLLHQADAMLGGNAAAEARQLPRQGLRHLLTAGDEG